MKKIALLTSLALTTLAADPAAAPAKDAQQLLRDGLFEEEANLDLGKAAAAYAEIVASYDVQRQISGTAVFRLAEIRAKQGKKDEAAALYQRVIAEFATFEQIAKPARERLAKLGAALPDAASRESGLTQAESDELAKLREMAANSPDLLNAYNPVGGQDTPLNRAAKNGWVKAAEFLLANGAEIEKAGINLPLVAAAQAGHKRMVELLLEKGASIEAYHEGYSPLLAACQAGRASVVRLLVERGATVNPPWKAGHTPLHVAVESGDVSIVRLLLEKGAKPDVVMKRGNDSFTPLGLAKTKEMAALLLEHKATPDLGLADGVVQPLTNAVRMGNPEIVELLIQRIGKVSDPQPLFDAVAQKDGAILEKLLAHHSNVDALDRDGRTPLLVAASQSPECIPALLKAGASANAKSPSGDTALLHLILHLLSLNQAPGLNPSQAAVSVARPPSGRRVVLPTPVGIPQPQPAIQPAAIPIRQSSAPLKREELQDIIKALIAHGADINAPVGTTPVLWHTQNDIDVFDWLVSLGADPNAKTSDGTPLISTVSNSTSRIAIEVRYVYPKSAPKDGVLINKLSGEPFVIRPNAEFEPLPTFAEALALAFPSGGRFGFESKLDVAIYRMGAKGRYEEAEKVTVKPLSPSAASDATTWPKLQAGDVLIIPMTHNGNPRNASEVQDWLVPALPHPRITVDVGGRTQSVVFAKADTGNSWAPVTELSPMRDIAAIAHQVSGEPAVDMSAVKVIRTVDGAKREWTVDLRPDPKTGNSAAFRLADGDRVVFPLKHTPESIATRRARIWSATPGRVFAEGQITRIEKGQRPPQLGDLLWNAASGTFVNVGVDFSKLTIHRLKGDAGEEERIVVDLDAPFARWTNGENDAAQKANVDLQWGDVVEFAKLPGVKPEELRDYASGERGEFIRDMRKRTVTVTAGGAPEKVGLKAGEMGKARFIGSETMANWQIDGQVDGAFLLVTLVQRELGGKRCRVLLKSGDRTRTISPDEVATFAEPLRDGDSVDITEL